MSWESFKEWVKIGLLFVVTMPFTVLGIQGELEQRKKTRKDEWIWLAEECLEYETRSEAGGLTDDDYR